MRYDRAWVPLDRYATYIVAAFVAGRPGSTQRSSDGNVVRYRVTACYAVTGTEPGGLLSCLMPEDILSRAVENGDEHVIKFTDVALLAHQRGCMASLSAASHATSLVD